MRTLTFGAGFAAMTAFVAVVSAQSLEVQLQRAEQREIATGNLKAAIDEYKSIASRAGKDHAVAAKALLRMAQAHQKLGDAEAQKIYQEIVRDYADQSAAVTTARANLGGGGAAAADRLLWALPVGSKATFSRVSPDGRFVAYSSGADVMVRELGTTMTRTVAHFAAGSPGMTMAWSPDGRRLAFEFFDKANEIRAINVDGSGMRTLISGIQGWARVLDFFPDGNRVLCSRNQNGDSMVFVVDLDGKVQDLTLRKGSGGSGWPRLSPDGRYVALRNSPGLSLLAVDGSGETVISRDGGDLNAAGWTPDGSRLLFVRQQGERVDLWAAPIANGKPNGPAVLAYRDFGSISVIENQVMKDGSLYYVKGASGGGEGEVYSASVDFASGKLLTEPLPEFSGNGTPLWSPDGKYLAFARTGLGNRTMMVRSVDTGQVRSVDIKSPGLDLADWSPDGQKILASGRRGIVAVDVQTGESQAIATDPAGIISDDPRYSADGRKVYFRRRRKPQDQVLYSILEHDLATGQESVVIDDTDLPLGGIRPSPDGRYLAYGVRDINGTKDALVRIRPFAGGETRELRVPSTEATYCHPMDWLPDSSALIYHCDGASASAAATWILPMASFKPRKLEVGFGEVMVSVHPDGRRMAFSETLPRPAELHVLQNFLPPVK